MNKRRSSENENPFLLPHLPDELILEILLRLPVRSLLRFKSVCKSWLSRISDSQFAKSHFDLAASPTHRLFLNDAPGFKIESFDTDSSLHDDSAVVNLKFPLAPPCPRMLLWANTRLMVLGSCRGFVFLANYKGDIVVWNPSTGERRRIPDSFNMALEFLYGIGYDKISDDYLLIYIESNDLVVAEYMPEIKIFSLKYNSHILFGMNDEYVDLGSDFRPGLFFNDSLHWLVKSRVRKVRTVIAFDFVEGGLLEIPLSLHDLAVELGDDNKEYHLRVMGGCLCLCYSRVGMAEIWMMKEYKVESSWTKIVLSAYDMPCNSFFPIWFTKCGDIFGSNEVGRLLKLNDKGNLLEHRALWKGKGERSYRLLYTRMYTESLLSLPEMVSGHYPPEYYPPFTGFEEIDAHEQQPGDLHQGGEDDQQPGDLDQGIEDDQQPGDLDQGIEDDQQASGDDQQPGDLDQESEDDQQASEDDQQPNYSEEELADDQNPGDFDEATGDDQH